MQPLGAHRGEPNLLAPLHREWEWWIDMKRLPIMSGYGAKKNIVEEPRFRFRLQEHEHRHLERIESSMERLRQSAQIYYRLARLSPPADG